MDSRMDNETLKELQDTMLQILDEVDRVCNENGLEYFLIGGTLLGAVRHKGFIPWDDDLDIAMPRKDYDRFIEIARTTLNTQYEIDNFYTNDAYYLNFTKVRKKDTLFVQSFQENYNGPKGIWIDIFPLDNWKKEKGLLDDFHVRIIKALRAIAHYKTGIFLGNKNTMVLTIKKTLAFLAKPFSTGSLMKLANSLMKKYKDNETEYFINISSQYHFHKQTILKSKFYPIVELDFCGKKYSCPNDYDYILNRLYGDYMKLPPKEKQITHNPVKLKF